MQSRLKMPQITGEVAYQELTAYLQPTDLAILTRGMAELPTTLRSDEELAKKIQQGEWQALLGSANSERLHFPFQALRCLRRGLITGTTFSTSQMFYNAYTHPNNAEADIRVLAIFNAEKKLIRTTRQIIDETMLLNSPSKQAFEEQKEQELMMLLSPLSTALSGQDMIRLLKITSSDKKPEVTEWTERSERLFYHLLKQLPPSEQQFLVIPDPHYDRTTNRFKYGSSVMKLINYEMEYNVFSRFMGADKKPYCILPTRGMMQAFLEATRQGNTPLPKYRFNLSSIYALHDTMRRGGRDMYQAFAPLPHLAPDTVDNHAADAQECGAEKHDFYHQTRAADVPTLEAKLFAEIATVMRQISKVEPACDEKAANFMAKISDMECPIYNPKVLIKQPHRDLELNAPFSKVFKTLDACFHGAKGASTTNATLTSTHNEKDLAAAYLAEYFIYNEIRLEKDYGLSLNHVMSFESTEGGFIKALVKQIQVKLAQRTNRAIPDLAMEFHTEQPLGPTLKNALMHSVIKMLDMHFVENIYLAFETESQMMIDVISHAVSQKFRTYFISGALANLQQAHPRLFKKLMLAVGATANGEDLLITAVKEYEDKPEMFNMLYDPCFVNRASMPGNTLVFHAIAADQPELVLRLTNDGATVNELPHSKKPSPQQKAIAMKCKDLQALIMMAEKGGKGWVDASPTIVARLRRLAAYRKEEVSHDTDKFKADMKWLDEIITPTRHHGLQNTNTLFANRIRIDEMDALKLRAFFSNK